MKRMGKIRAILLTCALFITPLTVSALPTEGEWSATEISADETVNLTGDVKISGTISINNGCTLTINNATGRTLSITPTAKMDDLFMVNSGGKLVINGNASGSSAINYDGIIINGGASLTWNDYNLSGTESYIRRVIRANGDFDIKNVTIENIYRTGEYDYACNGIYFTGGSYGAISHCEFKYLRGYAGAAVLCINSNASGSTLDIADSHFINCGTNGKLGSTIRSVGVSTTTLTMTKTCMENCYSTGHGGAVYWNAHGRSDTCCKFDGCQFLSNKANIMGGALFIETSVSFINNKTTIKGNTTVGDGGGGICINGYTLSDGKPFDKLVASIDDKLEIVENSAPNGCGGGLFFRFEAWTLAANNATITYNIEGAVIKDNEADYGGGTYFLNKISADKNVAFTVNLNYGDIIGNTAEYNGGGIYLEGLDIGYSGSEGRICNVWQNKANNGGGIFIENGNLMLDKVDINKNTATANGGGVCINGGTFAIKAGTISQNSCTNYGGGVYSSYTGTDYISSSLSGGTVNANSAFAGGGICVNGKINFTTTATNIEGNTATNGGGICVINGAKMTYESGLIRNNTAKTTTDMKGQTAFQKGVTKVSGIGGGVFLADNAALSFNVSSDFGLYGNTATNGADDIFANGNGTSISLPDVSSMNLSGYNIKLPKNSLYWVEDYITDDANYTSGTNVMGGNYPGTNLGRAYKNWRYRYALDNDEYGFYSVSGTPKTLTCYTSLALGYHLVYITVIKTGMKPGHNAMFKIKSDGASKDYMTFILKEKDKVPESEQPDGTITLKKRVRLISGTWTVWEDESWSWAYTATEPKTYTRTLNEESSAEDLTFRFSNTPKANVPQHAEDVKVNTIKL